MNNSIICLLILLLLVSCHHSNRDNHTSFLNKRNASLTLVNEKTLDIEISQLENVIMSSEVFDSIGFIDLETTPDNLIGNIKKIISNNNEIIIFDDITQSILLFSQDGVYKKSFNKKGRGPVEFASINDFDIDPETDNIILLVNNKDLMILNSNLEFIEKVNTGVMGNGLMCLPSSIIAIYTGTYSTFLDSEKKDNYQLVLISLKSKKRIGLFPNSLAKKVGLVTEYAFSRSQKLVLSYPLTNKYYTFTKNGIQEGSIDFKTLKYSIEDETSFSIGNYLNIDNKAKFFHKFYFINDWLFFTGIYNRKDLYCFINQKEKRKFCSTEIFNDISSLPLIKIVGCFEKGLLIELLPSNYLGKKDLELPKNLPKRDFLDNPIIQKCYVNQN